MILVVGVSAPALAGSCSVELSGNFRCDDGTTLKSNGLGGFTSSNGATLSPDGSGGFRSQDGSTALKQNGYGGLTNEGGGNGLSGGSYGGPLQTRLPQGSDLGAGRRVGVYGFAQPQANRDCRSDAFGGYRCR